MKKRITADSTCDLGEELALRYGVKIMPLTVTMGAKDFRDGVDVTPQDIFGFVAESGVLPKTSAPSAEEYAEFFGKCLETDDAVINLNF